MITIFVNVLVLVISSIITSYKLLCVCVVKIIHQNHEQRYTKQGSHLIFFFRDAPDSVFKPAARAVSQHHKRTLHILKSPD